MTKSELEDLLAVARSAGREAAALVLRGFRKHPSIEHKADNNLVTSFDRESEALLRARLAPLGIPIVGEELGGSRPGAGLALFVDPLDGTTNFVHGHPFWCVSIGLVWGDEPILGVVVAPSLGLEWWGWIADDGAHEARRRTASAEESCAVSGGSRLPDALLATGFPYDRRTSAENNFDAFVAIKMQVRGIRRCGSAAVELCLVADGTYEGYWERRLGPWDLAGGAAIVRAAGGRVTDLRGGPTFLASGDIAATNGVLHDALVAAIAAASAPRP